MPAGFFTPINFNFRAYRKTSSPLCLVGSNGNIAEYKPRHGGAAMTGLEEDTRRYGITTDELASTLDKENSDRRSVVAEDAFTPGIDVGDCGGSDEEHHA